MRVQVEPAVILRLVGKGRVTGFVVREVVNSTLATFVEEVSGTGRLPVKHLARKGGVQCLETGIMLLPSSPVFQFNTQPESIRTRRISGESSDVNFAQL